MVRTCRACWQKTLSHEGHADRVPGWLNLGTSAPQMKQAIQLGTLSAANIGVAFLFQWYVLTHLGPGIETDALFAGMTLPQLVLAVISGSLMHV